MSAPPRSGTPTIQPTPQPPVVLPAPIVVKDSIKVNKPDLYHGKPDALEAFLSQMRLYLLFNQTQFKNDYERVVYATTFLRDRPFEWADAYVKDYLENGDNADDETKRILGNYNNFTAKLKEYFGDIDELRKAERILQNIKQKTSAAAYTAEFRRWAIKTEWDDAAQIANYYAGLKDEVKDELSRHNRPDTLDEMAKIAIRIDSRLYERLLEKRGEYGHVSSSSRKNDKAKGGHHNSKPYYGSQPMELDATSRRKHRKGGKWKPKTPAQGNGQKKKQIQCYNCNLFGHIAKNCFKKKADPKPKQLYGTGKPQQLNCTIIDKYVQDPNAAVDLEKSRWVACHENTCTTYQQIMHKAQEIVDKDHASLSWTVCYNDYCRIHESDKEASGWYPKAPKGLKEKKCKPIQLGVCKLDEDWENPTEEGMAYPYNPNYLSEDSELEEGEIEEYYPTKEYNTDEDVWDDNADYNDDRWDSEEQDEPSQEDLTEWDIMNDEAEICALEVDHEAFMRSQDWGSDSDSDAMDCDSTQTVKGDEVPKEEVDLEPVKPEDIQPVEPLIMRTPTPMPRNMGYPQLPTSGRENPQKKKDPQSAISWTVKPTPRHAITSWDGPCYVRAYNSRNPRVYPDTPVSGETREEKKWRECQRPRHLPLENPEETNFATIIQEHLPKGGHFTPDGGYWTPDGLLIPGDLRLAMNRLQLRYKALQFQTRVPEPKN